MTLYAKDTSVPVVRSRAEIEDRAKAARRTFEREFQMTMKRVQMRPVMSADATLVVGATPSYLHDNLMPKLLRYGITVKWHLEMEKKFSPSIPKGCNLVLIIADMVPQSKSVLRNFRDLCSEEGIPMISTMRKEASFSRDLERHGFQRRDPLVIPALPVAPAAEIQRIEQEIEKARPLFSNGASNGVDLSKKYGLKTELTLVTPALAVEWLEKNKENRAIRHRQVEFLSNAIKRGEWKVTHQGIAFGQDGSLYDGQHRLWAVVEANVPVHMMVTWGLPASARADIDTQTRRTVGDNLKIIHGIVDGKAKVEALNMIRLLVSKDNSPATHDQVVQMLEDYREGLNFMTAIHKRKDKLFSAPVRGAIVFAHRTAPEKVEEFVRQYTTGEMLAGDSGIFLLRSLMLGSSNRGNTSADRRVLTVKALRAIAAHIMDTKIAILYPTEDAVAFFGKAHGLELPGSSTSVSPEVAMRRAGGRQAKAEV